MIIYDLIDDARERKYVCEMRARVQDGAGTAHSALVSVLHLSYLIYGTTTDRSDIASGLVILAPCVMYPLCYDLI